MKCYVCGRYGKSPDCGKYSVCYKCLKKKDELYVKLIAKREQIREEAKDNESECTYLLQEIKDVGNLLRTESIMRISSEIGDERLKNPGYTRIRASSVTDVVKQGLKTIYKQQIKRAKTFLGESNE